MGSKSRGVESGLVERWYGEWIGDEDEDGDEEVVYES